MSARLAVVTNDRAEVFQRSVIAGTAEFARSRGFELAIAELSAPVGDLASLPLELEGLAGVLVIASVLPDAVLAELAGRLPLTLVSHRLPGGLPSVMHDNAQGMALLVAHLVQDCRRSRLAFIRGDMTQTDGVEREAAFRRELMRHGLEVPEARFLSGGFDPGRAAASLEALLARKPDIDAIVSADYLMAIAALEVLHEADVEVPARVAVGGFGDGPEAAKAGLTTVAADVVELGRRGARQLIGQIEGLEVRGQTLLSTTLVRRASSC